MLDALDFFMFLLASAISCKTSTKRSTASECAGDNVVCLGVPAKGEGFGAGGAVWVMNCLYFSGIGIGVSLISFGGGLRD
jgi:hypothetical protein